MTLSWQTRETTGCAASGSWSGSRPDSGSESITFDAAGTYSYTLACDGIGGDATSTVSISVTQPPPVDARSGGGASDSVMLALLALAGWLRRRYELRASAASMP